MDLNLAVYSNCILSTISIYKDSKIIRERKIDDLHSSLESKSEWTDEEFNWFTHYEYHFEWLLLHSLFITSFSYLEGFLKSTSEELEKNNSIKLKDIREGKGYLDKYRIYLNILGLESAAIDNKNWSSILSFKDIRNSLIHEFGKIKYDSSKVIEHNLYFGPSKRRIRIFDENF
ncbi:hypothetical protein KJK34_04440 [Flavobacterium sp. D11R37]|nr:hypothetical protein [Flavobacterium coralii]